MQTYTRRSKISALAGLLFLLLLLPGLSAAFPVAITDDSGQTINFEKSPQRVVCLVPSVTEILVALGAQDTLRGITYHSDDLLIGGQAALVGGFFSPSLEKIEALRPEVIFLSLHHQKIRQRLKNIPDCQPVVCETTSLADSYQDIRKLGKIFGKDKQAEKIVAGIQSQLALIAEKTVRIPQEKRKRVLRLMGRETIMTPGGGSFQQEIIRAAGGISHNFAQKGQIIPVTRKQWRRFNPQFIYGCGGDRQTAERFFNMPGWQEAAAIISHDISFFPCDLTCRASTHTGDFVSWLAASIYTGPFSRPENLVRPETVLATTDVKTDTGTPAYVRRRSLLHSRIYDFEHQTLVLDFTEPMTVLSSLEGMRRKITSVGNHYMPPPCWPISHTVGLSEFRDHVRTVLGRDQTRSAFLFTGAKMDNLAVEEAQYRELRVWAYVTAGVSGNAVRMSRSSGTFYEPGTINIILLTNHQLSERALTRAVITATEAKTAALLDMDIRVSDTQGAWRATGTGTDNIIVVQGTGKCLDNAGGHSKLGELIGRAVHGGVKRAVRRQNHWTVSRNIFQRLEERGLSPAGLIYSAPCDCFQGKEGDLVGEVEKILLDPRYAGFIELALAASDDYEKGLITDITGFERLARQISAEIAGQPVGELRDLAGGESIPRVLRTALNAILTGVEKQTRQK